MSKIAIFAFKGNSICFVHVLLNALDLHNKGGSVKIILEGESTKLIIDLCKPEHPLQPLYEKVKNLGLIDAVCRAFAIKMDALEVVEAEGLKIVDAMAGHSAMAPYIEKGYVIVTL